MSKNTSAVAARVSTLASVQEMAVAAAAEAAEVLREAIAARGEARAILATGNSQTEFAKALVKEPGVDWAKCTLFHMDEYLGIDANHSASFRRWMRERIEAVLAPGTFHYIQGDAWQPIAECERYEALLRERPMDLCCLGIGENGHLAFNDPPVASFDEPRWAKIVKLDEGCRRQQVGEGHFPNMDSVPQFAISLTIPALLAPTRVLAIVPERRKAEAVKAALEGPVSTACPASILRERANVSIYLDPESASLLSA